MAKLAVVASLLLALLAIAEASTYTTITTTVVEEGNPQQRCSQQVHRQPLRQCSRYLSPRGTPYEAEIELDLNPTGMSQQQLQQCCQELRNIDPQCRCEAIREVVRRKQQGQGQGGQWEGQGGQWEGQGGQWQGQEMQQVVQKAQNLPQRCNMRQPQQCQIRAIWF